MVKFFSVDYRRMLRHIILEMRHFFACFGICKVSYQYHSILLSLHVVISNHTVFDLKKKNRKMHEISRKYDGEISFSVRLNSYVFLEGYIPGSNLEPIRWYTESKTTLQSTGSHKIYRYNGESERGALMENGTISALHRNARKCVKLISGS